MIIVDDLVEIPVSAASIDGGMCPTSRQTEKSIIMGQNNVMFTTNDWEW